MTKMNWMLIVAGALLTLTTTGCSKSTANTACAPVENGVAVCVNGKAVTWSTTIAKPPHMHEAGGYYAPVEGLKTALGAKAEVSLDKKNVTINGKVVKSTAKEALNIHDHNGQVYAPIKEFAEAAGYTVTVDTTKNVITITK